MKLVAGTPIFFVTPGLANILEEDLDFLEEDLGAQGILSPNNYFQLGAEEIVELAKYIKFINTNWKLSSSVSSIDRVARIKTQKPTEKYSNLINRPPSYSSEYRLAIEALRKLSLKYGESGALNEIFRWDEVITQKPGYERTRRAHIRKYVINEFSYLIVQEGGYERFGYKNYRAVTKVPLQDTEFDSPHWPYAIYKGSQGNNKGDFELPLLGDDG